MKIPNTKSVIETAVELQTTVPRVLQMIADGDIEAINTSKGSKRPRWAIPNSSIKALSKPKQVSAKRKIKQYV